MEKSTSNAVCEARIAHQMQALEIATAAKKLAVIASGEVLWSALHVIERAGYAQGTGEAYDLGFAAAKLWLAREMQGLPPLPDQDEGRRT